MHATFFLLFFGPAVHQVLARPAASCGASQNGKAIYMITNDKVNAVVAIPIGRNGLLRASGTSSTPTGGEGANGIDGSTNQPSAPDALFSQSSLTLAGNVWATQRLLILNFDKYMLTRSLPEPVCSQCRVEYPFHVRHRP